MAQAMPNWNVPKGGFLTEVDDAVKVCGPAPLILPISPTLTPVPLKENRKWFPVSTKLNSGSSVTLKRTPVPTWLNDTLP